MPILQAHKGNKAIFPDPQVFDDFLQALDVGNQLITDGRADEVTLTIDDGLAVSYSKPQSLDRVLKGLVETLQASQRFKALKPKP